MADPVSISFTLQNLKCTLQALKVYQRLSGDRSEDALIVSLQATLNSNQNAASPPVGYPSALAQSADGET